jgi:tRNA pseudouridine55 synthase
MNGVLVVDKPAGPTSHDVVARTRRALGTSHIGHTGTLDPFATGVLPLVIGRATRLAQFLTSDEKEYEAGVRFGRSTPTYDADDRFSPDTGDCRGSLRQPVPPPDGVDAAGIQALLSDFTGGYLQMPPPFSAKKISGVPAYKLARRNQPVQIRPVPVSVRELTLESYSDGLARLRLVCSAGFYVRTLAHELGQRLGCGAHLESLRRTRAGSFGLDRAVPLDVIERLGTAAAVHLIPMGSLLPCLPPVVVNERGARRAAHGNALTPADLSSPPESTAGGRLRILDEDGTLLGIAEPTDGGLLHPVVVLV